MHPLTEIYQRLHQFFGDWEKVDLWMTLPNPQFGDIVPMDLVKMGRTHVVLKFIRFKDC